MNSAICTIASKNYLAHVRALTESFRRHHPDAPVYMLLVDRLDGRYDSQAEPFTTVSLDDLPIRNLPGFCFQYTILELNTAVKPFLLEFLFERYDFGKLLYFDPDIKFYAPVTALFDALDAASAVLIPHLTAPLADEAKPNELDVLRAGGYNLGFLGLARGAIATNLLRWWQHKLYTSCVVNFEKGLFTDQRWMDLVPGMFEGVSIFRAPGYDVAYWNIQHQRLECRDGQYLANGEPLRFFHFSGFNPSDREAISKHQNRYRLHEVPCLPELFTDYENDLKRLGYDQVKGWPYAFANFDDDTPIPEIAREVYRDMGTAAEPFGNPFKTGPGSFLDWLNQPAEGTGAGEPVITHLAQEIWLRQDHLQRAYPSPPGKDRDALAVWMAAVGAKEFGLDQAFVDALRLSRVPTSAAAERQAAEMARLGEQSRRARVATAIARTGIGKLARRVIGEHLTTRIRDRIRWGARAPVAPLTPVELGLVRDRIAIEGQLGANVVGYISSESGVGESARSIIRSLRAVDVATAGTLVDIYCGHRKHDESCAGLPAGNPYPFNVLCLNPEETPEIFSRLGPDFFRGQLNIGYWFWELEHFPERWLDRFEYLDEVWVASSFCQDGVARAASVPVCRIPLSIEVQDIAPVPEEVLDVPEDQFVFLFVFDYHSFPERKNPLAVVRAFQRAFAPEAKVHLVVKGTDSRGDPAYHARLMAEARPGQVTLIDRYLDRNVINGLLARCDCYVSLHRAEGFGLTLAEAMYLGKPVIATAYSGNMDFTRPDNSYLVPYRLVDIDQDYGPYKKGWAWAEPDAEDAVETMLHVFADRDEAAAVGRRAAEFVRSSYSPATVGERIKQRLALLLRHHAAS